MVFDSSEIKIEKFIAVSFHAFYIYMWLQVSGLQNLNIPQNCDN